MGWGYLKSWFAFTWYKVTSFFLFQKELSIAVIGLQNSGKTTFVQLLGGNSYQADTVPTLGIQVKTFALNNNSVKVYDLAGQTRFQPLWERCFDKVDLIVYVIDLSDLNSLEESFTKLKRVIQMTNDDKIPLLIMGNKIDVIPDVNIMNPHYSTKCLRGSILTDYGYDAIESCKMDPSNLYQLKEVDTLSKRLGIDLRNCLLRMPFIGLDPTEQLPLDRDISIFMVSCKTGRFIKDVIDWIVQL